MSQNKYELTAIELLAPKADRSLGESFQPLASSSVPLDKSSMKDKEKNILVPFPSEYDDKLKVSGYSADKELQLVKAESLRVRNYDEALSVIWDLPSLLSETATPEGVGAVGFSRKSKNKLIFQIGNLGRAHQFAYIQALPYLVDIIKNSVLLEEHRDREKSTFGKRLASNPSDRNIEKIQRLYGGFSCLGDLYRVKTTIQVYRTQGKDRGRCHGYDITEIELLRPKTEVATNGRPQSLHYNSILLTNLLQNVELSYESGVGLKPKRRIKTKE